jgi:hypothetical protein
LHLEQLHSEVIWQTDFLHSDKLTKPFVKAHGQHLIHLNLLSIFVLLVVAEVMTLMAVAAALVVCLQVLFL